MTDRPRTPDPGEPAHARDAGPQSVVPDDWFRRFEPSGLIDPSETVKWLNQQSVAGAFVPHGPGGIAEQLRETMHQLVLHPHPRVYRGEKKPAKRARRALEALSEALTGLVTGDQLRTWRDRAELELLRQEFAALDRKVDSLSQDFSRENNERKSLQGRIARVEGTLGIAPDVPTRVSEVPIDWQFVQLAVEAAAHKLGWSVLWDYLRAGAIVRATVPQGKDDLIAEQRLLFYSLLASALDTNVLRALRFEFVPEDEVTVT